jgi:hypothetical protein
MAKAILRVEKLKTLGNVAGSLSHTYRTRETQNANPERFDDNTLHSSPETVLAALKARLPLKRRKDAVVCLEYFIGASPEWFVGRSQADQDKYFADALAWLKLRHGADNVLDFSIHRDETSPHLVAYVVPLVDGKLNAKRFTGGRTALSVMQTEFAKKVGLPYGLERGVEGSKARHTTIKEYYAGVGMVVPEKTFVEAPEPSMAERLKPAVYGQRVADEVVAKFTPALNAARAQQVELELERKRFKDLNARTARTGQRAKEATARAEAAEAEVQRLGEIVELFTPGEIEQARQRRAAELEAARVEAEKTAIRAERQRRVNAITGLLKSTVGAAHTFVQQAIDYLRDSPNTRRDGWRAVEAKTIEEAITQNGQEPDAVLRDLCELSPWLVTDGEQQELRSYLEKNGPAMQAVYERSRGRGNDLDR